MNLQLTYTNAIKLPYWFLLLRMTVLKVPRQQNVKVSNIQLLCNYKKTFWRARTFMANRCGSARATDALLWYLPLHWLDPSSLDLSHPLTADAKQLNSPMAQNHVLVADARLPAPVTSAYICMPKSHAVDEGLLRPSFSPTFLYHSSKNEWRKCHMGIVQVHYSHQSENLYSTSWA